MKTEYDFGLRYRSGEEPRGLGSLVFAFAAFEDHLTTLVSRVMREIDRTNPALEFDGLVMYGVRET